MPQDKLIEKAIEYREKAYAPYSNFKVGAAVLGGSGAIYGGCNVENSSYGMTICAERVAISKAVSEGEREIKKIAVVTAQKEISLPCGACRQVINEFGKQAEVLCCDIDGSCDHYHVEDLIPHFDRQGAFTKALEDLKSK